MMMTRQLQVKATAIVLLSTTAMMMTSVTAQSFPMEKPLIRYTPFANLDTNTQIVVQQLGYTSTTWNNHGLATIERKRWDTLTSSQQDAAILLGYGEKSWDCFMNHYLAYTWVELATAGVQDEYVKLGWTNTNWMATSPTDVPFTESLWWDELSVSEKATANGLCFFKANWDRVDMNPNPSFFPHPLPNFRYKPFTELSPEKQNIVTSLLNYTESTWNNLDTALVEKNTFLNLNEDARNGALELGFYTHTWDCYINHYQAYFWSSFHEDLRLAVTTLGWTEDMWSDDAETYPPSEVTRWADLTPNEKAAATRLCYFQEIWDAVPMTQWYDYNTKKNTAVTADEYSGPVPAEINLNIFKETGYAGRDPEVVILGALENSNSASLFGTIVSSLMVLTLSICLFFHV